MNETAEYACHGCHDSLPNGKASGILRIGISRFDYKVGGQRGFIPFAGAEIKLGGASDRLIFITHPAIPGWTLYTSDLTLLKNPRLREQPEFRAQMGKAKTRRKLNWGLLALVTVLIIATPLALLLYMDSVSALIASGIPARWERSLGESSLEQYRQSRRFLEREQSAKLLKPLLTPLLNVQAQEPDGRGYRYQFYIVNDSSLNAFALPGGYVVVHSGLILKAGRAEELIGVLAHEMIHVEQQHGVRNIIGTLGLYTIVSAVLGNVDGVLASLAGAAPLLLKQSYSRRFEKQADTLAYELLQTAGIDPGGLADFFIKLVAEEKSRLTLVENEDAQAVIKDAMRILSSHPASEDRIAYLNALAGEATAGNLNLSQPFARLQKAVQLYILEDKGSE